MVVVAFVLSIVAVLASIAGVLVSIASVRYTRRQTLATEQTRTIEADRRHDELAPEVVGEYVDASSTRGGERPEVRLTNRRGLDFERLEVQMIPAHRLAERVIEGIHDVRTGGTLPYLETGPIPLGESWSFEVIPLRETIGDQTRDRSGTVSFRCRCFAAGHSEPWTVTVDVDFPGEPMAEIF